MKAIVYEKYGSPDVLRLEEVARPTPEGDEVLVRIHAVSVNGPDWRLMRANPFLGEWRQIRQAMLWGPLLSLVGTRKLGPCEAQANQEDLTYLAELLEAGKLAPIIDRRFPLNAVPDAMRYAEEGHARGKIVIDVDSDAPRSRRSETVTRTTA